MATFLAERYWPGVTPAAARAVTEAVGRDGGEGRVRVLETIVAGDDEVCFWYVEAATAGDVASAFAAAEVTIHRIAPAQSTTADG